MHVELVDEEELEALTVIRSGPYPESAPAAFSAIWDWIMAKGHAPRVRAVYGAGLDAPGSVPDAALRYAACVVFDETPEPDGEIKRDVLKGGPAAQVTVMGPYTGIPAAFDHIMGPWMEAHGREIAPDRVFRELYCNMPGDVPDEELKTIIAVPLKPI